METRRDQRVYKFNITQHHNPYISCFVIVNHLSQLPYLKYITNQVNVFSQISDSVYQLGDSAFEHIISPCIYTITKQLM